jgi:hypothetical protein
MLLPVHKVTRVSDYIPEVTVEFPFLSVEHGLHSRRDDFDDNQNHMEAAIQYEKMFFFVIDRHLTLLSNYLTKK